jgi:hypothetical protein
MKPRGLALAITAIGAIFAVQFAWWLAQPASRVARTSAAVRAAPVVTETGQVIPAAPGMPFATAAAPALPGVAARNPAGAGVAARRPKPPETPGPAGAGASGASRDAALVEVAKVRHMISDYHTLMGENPVGTNAEIMKAVMGANKHQAMLGPPEGQTLNDQGELVDQWGTPYFFHQLSADRMEIYSAGPDKILGTADDIVVRK